MARSRTNGPVPARRRNVDAVTGPSLRPAFENITSFVNDIVQYSTQVFEALQALGRRHTRDHLGRVQGLKHQVERVRTDVSDMRRSQFAGLRHLCTDRQPECIVLDELQTLRSELKSVYQRLLEISRDVLHDEHAVLQCESFQEFDRNISEVITRTREEWEEIPHSPGTLLCHSAVTMIEGNDTGSVRRARTTDHQEHGILRQRQGLFQHWCCPECPRNVKFFAKREDTSLGSATFPPRVADGTFHSRVAWRDVWCAKSHLKPGHGARYICLLCLGEGQLSGAGQAPCPTFDDGKDLIKHIAEKHNSSTLPKVFMQKLHITKSSDQDEIRSDLKFLRE